jgi:hypothetical protein
LLILKIREFWDKLPCYAGKKPPKFSNGWLAGFKSRYSIKKRQRHREGASAQVNNNSEQIIAEIQKKAEEYRPDLTYNIDKSGYY